MPSLNEHMKRSVERTGESYRELNEWLDGNHVTSLQRLQRHLGFKRYSKYVQGKWGGEGLKEYRNHLDDDYRTLIATPELILRRKLMRQTMKEVSWRDE